MRESTTVTGIDASRAASAAESTVPDMSPDRCTETTAVAPAAAASAYACANRSGAGRDVLTTLQSRSAAATSVGVISVPSSYGVAVDDDLHGHDADAARRDEVGRAGTPSSR